MDPRELTRKIAGKRVSHVTQPDRAQVVIHFADGCMLGLTRRGDGLTATLDMDALSHERPRHARDRATRRQGEYLDFIERYTQRYGIPPAESDIERHVLVSAPSVNQMIQTLERRGLITRQKDAFGRAVPRSIRVVDA